MTFLDARQHSSVSLGIPPECGMYGQTLKIVDEKDKKKRHRKKDMKKRHEKETQKKTQKKDTKKRRKKRHFLKKLK